jgi:hypothetical protein
MTEVATDSSVAPLPLLTRAIGVITSPTAIFKNVAQAPRPFAILFLVAAVIAIGSSVPQFTEAGRKATIDMQVRMAERFGQTINADQYAALETRSRSVPLKIVGIASTFVFLPIVSLIFTAIYWAFFNTILGGTASFKQVLAIVTHSQVIGALGILVSVPIQLMQGTITMAGPFNLGALAPMLEEGSHMATFLGSISVFTLWGMAVNGIGLGVLYKRSAVNIAIGIIVVYLLLAYGISGFFSSFTGAA